MDIKRATLVLEGGALEMRLPSGARGFESLRLRQIIQSSDGFSFEDFLIFSSMKYEAFIRFFR